MMPHTQKVLGLQVDEETRCVHWHSEIDRIAIKFYCCGLYYACFECHEATGCGKAAVWPKERFDEKAVLCGSCGHQLAIQEYLECASVCPSCNSRFNPGCSLHKHLYFA
ncbi:putative CHY-type Zn-finger protein [Planomicrobium koreense]|uniref:Putative CHY-type Zn-finger protein n=2 Tax=Caryophanaceae TaxID=186818 RepID=A0A7W8CQG2_9BACL|nr:putative CHY-type Zn-finger protein [Planococcus koreensis]